MRSDFSFNRVVSLQPKRSHLNVLTHLLSDWAMLRRSRMRSDFLLSMIFTAQSVYFTIPNGRQAGATIYTINTTTGEKKNTHIEASGTSSVF